MGKHTRERDISMCILMSSDTRKNLTGDGLPGNLNWILEFSPNAKGSVEVIDNIVSLTLLLLWALKLPLVLCLMSGMISHSSRKAFRWRTQNGLVKSMGLSLFDRHKQHLQASNIHILLLFLLQCWRWGRILICCLLTVMPTVAQVSGDPHLNSCSCRLLRIVISSLAVRIFCTQAWGCLPYH